MSTVSTFYIMIATEKQRTHVGNQCSWIISFLNMRGIQLPLPSSQVSYLLDYSIDETTITVHNSYGCRTPAQAKPPRSKSPEIKYLTNSSSFQVEFYSWKEMLTSLIHKPSSVLISMSDQTLNKKSKCLKRSPCPKSYIIQMLLL